MQDAINGGLTFALVINPIACGFTFLTLVLAIWFAFRHKHGLAPLIFGIISGLIAAILTTIAFAVDYVIMSVTKKNVEKISDNLHLTYGQTTWMTLAAMILTWIGVILFCIVGFRVRRTR